MPIAHRSGLHATRLGVLAVVAPVVGWSFSNTIVKIVHATGLQFAFWRLWAGAAAMVLILLVARRRLTWSLIKSSIVPGVLFGGNIALFFSALRFTGVADVLVIAALQPALVLLVAGRLFGERVTRSEVAWTMGSVGGVVAFVIGSRGTPVWSLAGDLLAFAGLLVFTGYFLISKRVRQRVQAIEYMTAVTLVAAVVFTPVAMASGNAEPLHGRDWLWLLVFVTTAQVGHLMLAWAHRHVDATVASLLLLGEPPLTALAGYLVLDETLTWLQVVAGLLAVGCLGVVVAKATRAGAAVAPAADAGAP
jgi:drug/metabolite transporter (DMT)-like permease